MGGYDGSIKIDSNINSKGFNKGISSMQSSIKKIGAAITAAFTVKVIADFVKSSVDAASELSNAYTGLNSILEGQGKSFSKAKSFIEEYTSDGLVAATEATTAYKNLAARGYSTEQIEQVMTALKDSATFGRQSSYTLGEAVQSASEGLKNENSILVDNAGVTKNVAKMWEDYAKSIGKTTSSLTQQEKIQAEVNGILQETKFQTGDSAIYLNTYSGQLARLNASFTTLKQSVGNAFIPIFQAILPYINAVIEGLTKVAQVFASVVQLIFGKTASTSKKIAENASNAAEGVTSLGNAAEQAGKQAKGALASFDDLNVLTQDTGSGSSTGGGASVDNIELGDLDTDTSVLTTVGEEVQSIAENILKFLEPLQKISLDNLNESFQKLNGSISGLGKTIWSGLEWAYFNLLVPLAKWTIEDYLPAFLYNLSGALDAVNGILQEVYPLLDWLWNSFLKPIASWSGDLIVDSLYAMGNALKWVGDNANIIIGIMAGLGAAWGVFKALDILGSIIQFVKYAGKLAGVTGVVKSVSAALSQLWTYFKAGSTVTKLTKTLTGLKTVFAGVASAIGISSGALLGILAAVAAGIYLLVTNWEEISAAMAPFINMFIEGIKVLWEEHLKPLVNSIGELLNSLMGLLTLLWENILKPLIDWIIATIIPVLVPIFEGILSTISEVFSSIADTIGGIIDTFRGLIDFIVGIFTGDWNKAWEGIKTFFSGIWDVIKGIVTTVWNAIKGVIQTVINTIKAIITTVFNAIKSFIGNIWNNIANTISNVWNTIVSKVKEGVSAAWNAITSVFGNVAGWFKEQFTKAWQNVKNVFSTGGKIFDGIKEGIASTFKTVVNAIIGGINKVIAIPFNAINKTLNKIKDASFLGVAPFQNMWGYNPLQVPQIPLLAKGAVIPPNQEFLAILGDQKQGRNLEAPESLIRQIVREETNNRNDRPIIINATFELEGTTIGRKIIEVINREQAAAGRTLLKV